LGATQALEALSRLRSVLRRPQLSPYPRRQHQHHGQHQLQHPNSTSNLMDRHTRGCHPQRRLERSNLRRRHLHRLNNNSNSSNNNNNNINSNSNIISISNIHRVFTLATLALTAIQEWLQGRWECSKFLRCRLGEGRPLRHLRHLLCKVWIQ